MGAAWRERPSPVAKRVPSSWYRLELRVPRDDLGLEIVWGGRDHAGEHEPTFMKVLSGAHEERDDLYGHTPNGSLVIDSGGGFW